MKRTDTKRIQRHLEALMKILEVSDYARQLTGYKSKEVRVLSNDIERVTQWEHSQT